MKILHFIPTFQHGGAERQLAMLAQQQAKSGLEVHVAFTSGGPEARRLSTDGAVAMHQLKGRGNHDPRLAFRAWRLIRAIEPDIVQTWLPQMDIVAGAAAVLNRRRWVISERSGPEAYRDRRLKDRILRPHLGKRASGVVANSSRGMSVWRDRLSSDVPVDIIRNMLPLREIRRIEPKPLTQIGLSAERPAAIFAGRLSPEKNVSTLLAIAEGIVRESTASFIICGGGPLLRDVRDRVQAGRHDERIKVLGFREDVPALLKSAQVFISPSAFEGHPNAVLEAMACGLDIVVSDIPAHREFLDGTPATLVPVDDAQAYVDAALAAIKASSGRAERRAAFTCMAEALDPEVIAHEYSVFYQKVLGARL